MIYDRLLALLYIRFGVQWFWRIRDAETKERRKDAMWWWGEHMFWYRMFISARG